MSSPSRPSDPSSTAMPSRQAAGRLARRGLRRMRSLAAPMRERLRILETERDHQALVLEVNRLLVEHLEPERLFQAISMALWPSTQHDFMSLTLLEDGGTTEWLRQLDTPPFRGRFTIGIDLPTRMGPSGLALQAGNIEVLGLEEIRILEPLEVSRLILQEGIRAMCILPLVTRGRAVGSLALGGRMDGHFTPDRIRRLDQVASLVAAALDNALAFEGIRNSRDRLAEEKLYLEEEVRQDFATHEIIGRSAALLAMLREIDTVAPSDATVLLLGETGTGKELVARAIHERSRRRARTFVRLNCSAIPLGLMESELFGHERGAFTGAIARKVGRFELAHQGTLFLDEVGDLPLELQPKLLRALQEREFERLGSNHTLSVDVRLIAATHRDLHAMVAEGTFRKDLFYRLNVFPVQVPPLRERRDDIPALVAYFAQKYSKAMDKRIDRIPKEAMEALMAWSWPGNIRELQNMVERSVILSRDGNLSVPISEFSRNAAPEAGASPRTRVDLEREGILAALRACSWVVGGPEGAAQRLGMKRTTLNSCMVRLGITRPR